MFNKLFYLFFFAILPSIRFNGMHISLFSLLYKFRRGCILLCINEANTISMQPVKLKKVIKFIGILAVFTALPLLNFNRVQATPNSNFTQTITAGTLATDIRDGSRVAVGTPSVGMGSKTFSFDCQTGGSAASGTFGTASERIYVDNPDGADNGWTLTIAGSATTALWTSGGNTFDYNDAGGSGCTDGADSDSKGGQMTIDPSVGTLTTDCGSCVVTNVTKGSADSFVEGTKDSLTLLNAAVNSDDIWRGYLTGVSIKNTIPAEQPASNNYTINLVLTATAL